MKGKTYLAFDFGEKRIGVAVGSDVAESTNPLTTIVATNDEERFKAIEPIVASWQPAAFVVGHPSHPDGTAHAMTARAERFARQLEGRFKLKAHLVDERYSSLDAAILLYASRNAKRKDKLTLDAEAAAEILRRFFQSGLHVEPVTLSADAKSDHE